jgi:tRNA U34 5-methylaminomethyl-2-thiouridine-forming methyltransferase MnmC
MASPFKLVTTADGSHSVFHLGLEEGFHSKYGAIAESKHIFIDAALDLFRAFDHRINILEIGFGTGLNALLSYCWGEQYTKAIGYYGIEAYPLSGSIISQLNYPEILNTSKEVFLSLHEAGDKMIQITDDFSLAVTHQKFEDINLIPDFYDVVFFDAFSPGVQPEMWSAEAFDGLFKAMKDGGVLTTYSTKGEVKRALKYAGFTIEKIPGPEGKREVLRAKKPFSIEL